MTTVRPGHLRDDELLRLLDRDDVPDELTRLQAHVADCDHCAGELSSLGHAAAVVRAGLRAADEVPVEGGEARRGGRPPTPPMAASPVWTRAWLRAAVVLLAVAGALVSVAPLRAHLGQWVAGAWEHVTGRSARLAAAPTAASAQPAIASAVVEFRTAGRELRIDLAQRQAAGTLVLERAAGALGSLEVVPSDVAIVPLASERLLEIRNPAASRASYIVRVPAGVEHVRVKVGPDPAWLLDPPATGALRIDVARR